MWDFKNYFAQKHGPYSFQIINPSQERSSKYPPELNLCLRQRWMQIVHMIKREEKVFFVCG